MALRAQPSSDPTLRVRRRSEQAGPHLLPDAKYVASFAAKITRLAHIAAASTDRRSALAWATGALLRQAHGLCWDASCTLASRSSRALSRRARTRSPAAAAQPRTHGNCVLSGLGQCACAHTGLYIYQFSHALAARSALAGSLWRSGAPTVTVCSSRWYACDSFLLVSGSGGSGGATAAPPATCGGSGLLNRHIPQHQRESTACALPPMSQHGTTANPARAWCLGRRRAMRSQSRGAAPGAANAARVWTRAAAHATAAG